MGFDPYQVVNTNFTKVVHSKPYSTISLDRPELSQKGKTVLVTGGATGIGFGIIQSYLKAGAESVIIAARRQNKLDEAAEKLKVEFGAETKIATYKLDHTDGPAVQAFWKDLGTKDVTVDVLVLNAVSFSAEGAILDIGAEGIWKVYEANVRGPLHMVEGLNKQPSDKKRYVLNVSSSVINMLYESQCWPSAQRPAYGMTKNAGTMLLSQIAKDVSVDKMQIISFNPGMIYNDEWESMGIKITDMPFDDMELAGNFAVWASSPEAAFLHGRFIWSSWNIDEYISGETRKRIDEDDGYLRVGVAGLNGAFRD